MRFRFVHAADLHLDSPLIGLASKSSRFAERVADASREAFDNLIALAIDEDCRLMVIAGDLFDGEWRDFRTGRFFVERMRRLRERNVRVVLILGNHDAGSSLARRLELSDNVTLLSSAQPQTVTFEEIGVAAHGRSFPRREVLENIALDYPPAIRGLFNIGVLHTAGSGRDGHARYAPCSVEQLKNHGYQYWALGHVHEREVLCEDPPIVFPGNLQGRNSRERGAKGASLVTVEHGVVVAIEHRALDAARFALETIDIGAFVERDQLICALRARAQAVVAGAEGRPLALRLVLSGSGPLHAGLAVERGRLREEIETLLAAVAETLWLEKLELRTSPPRAPAPLDPTVVGALAAAVDELSTADWLKARLDEKLAEIVAKLPAGAHGEALRQRLEADAAARARSLALALIETGGR